jgi:hypothetical protein
VIVYDLDILDTGIRPPEAHTELIIDTNAPLAGSVSLERLETIAGRSTQVIEVPKPPHSHSMVPGGFDVMS